MKATNHLIQTLFLVVFVAMFASGCVSVNIGSDKPVRSEKVRVSAPATPFMAQAESNADRSWQSSKTGSTISYFSECPEPVATLEFLATEFNSVLSNATQVKSEKRFFNGREALESVTEGNLDGIPMKIASLVFKRNGCSYLLSYVARKDRFDDEDAHFAKFLEGFQAP